jgi:hypothetical protein
LRDGKEKERPCKILEESGVQTYLRMEGGAVRTAMGGGNNSHTHENQITASPAHHFMLAGPVLQLHATCPPH